jgi:hypothetical protein
VSWPAVRIAVIVCFLSRPADVRDAPDVRSAQPVSVSYCEEPNLAKHDIGQLTALVKTRLRRMQYRPALLDGFLAKTGLDLSNFHN